MNDTPTLLTTLTMLTRQQRLRRWRDDRRQCRDVRRTRRAVDISSTAAPDPLDDLFTDNASRWLREIQAREALKQLLAILPEERYRTVVRLLLLGHSVPEIAYDLRRSVRAVQRYLVEIQTIWRSHPVGREMLA